MFTQFHFEANVLLSFRYSVSKQMLAQMVRRYIGYYRLISHFSFSKTNRAIPRRRRGEQLQNPWQEALRFAEDAVLMYRENHAVFVLLCQPKQHMWFDAKTPIYLLDLAQLVDKAIEDKWHGRHFSKIWKILSKCQQSNSDAAISTHHVSASTVNTSWAAYSLLGSNSGLDKALYTHTHTHTHTLKIPSKVSWAAFDLLDSTPALTRICEIHVGLQSLCLQLVTGAVAWSSVPEHNSPVWLK